MKRIKFKRKSKRIFLSKYFVAFVLIVFVLSISSAYALLRQDLNIIGNVSGQAVYTYYFEKPASWRGEYMHAHIWQNTSNGTSWPGLSMTHVTGTIYKVEVTSNMSFYSNHCYIIFNDCAYNGDPNGNQTSDIPLDKTTNNNQIFINNTYESDTEIRLFIRVPTSWTDIHVYMWGSSGENASWPGMKLSGMPNVTYKKISNEAYMIIFDKSAYSKYSNIIFNRGSGGNGNQTKDLSYPPPTQDSTYDCINNSGYWSSNTYNMGYWKDYIINPSLSPSHSH